MQKLDSRVGERGKELTVHTESTRKKRQEARKEYSVRLKQLSDSASCLSSWPVVVLQSNPSDLTWCDLSRKVQPYLPFYHFTIEERMSEIVRIRENRMREAKSEKEPKRERALSCIVSC